nr:50S ribosomal protein L11 methyltransferase [Altericroceibacterium endophyticum]
MVAHEEAWDWDMDIGLSGHEIAEDRPQDWVLEAWLEHEPTEADKQAFLALFAGEPPELETEQLPEIDWLTESQKGVKPITAGKFYIHTPDHPESADKSLTNFVIPASQAFGTGQHETTSGCLSMLTEMKRRGVKARNIADIGTGTGLLAFAALDLWPRAVATASDIDTVCTQVVEENARQNGIPMGAKRGEVTMLTADGMDDPLLQARAPYDLLIANILAGPLIDLAPDFAEAVPSGGHVLLAGLLESQEKKVRAAYMRAGLRLAARKVNGNWSILWLRRRPGI